MMNYKVIVLFCFLLSVCGCNPNDSQDSKGIFLSVENFPQLQNGSYELWLSFPSRSSLGRSPQEVPSFLHGDEEYISVGKFNVVEGKTVSLTGFDNPFVVPPEQNIQFAIDALITYQPFKTDTLYARICGGALRGDRTIGTSTLVTSDFDAFGNSLLNPSGSFVLDSDTGDFRRGIWFSNEQLQNALNLRFLTSSRWVYEARVRNSETGVIDTVMTFQHPSLVINTSNNLVGRLFDNGINLASGTSIAEIVVKPINRSSTDYAITLLKATIESGIAQKEVVVMQPQSQFFPKANLTLRK